MTRRAQFETLVDKVAPGLKPEDRAWICAVYTSAADHADGQRQWIQAAGKRLLALTENARISSTDRKRIRALAQRMAEAQPDSIAAFTAARLAGALGRSSVNLRKYRKGRKAASYGPLKVALLAYLRPGVTAEQALAKFERDADSIDGERITWLDDAGEHTTARKTVRNAIAALMKAVPT